MSRTTTLQLSDLEATERLSQRLASALFGGVLLTLSGDLGAGKTTLTRELSRGLGCSRLATSPTYTLFSPCPGGRLPLLHGDLYRLSGAGELEDLGFSEMLEQYRDGVVVLEWGERFSELLPADRLKLHLEYGSAEEERSLALEASGTQAERVLALLSRSLEEAR